MIKLKYKIFLITGEVGKIRIQNTQTGAEKVIKVTTDEYSDFIFKCLKTQIKTRYTVPELLDWMRSLIDKDFGTAYISAICNKYFA